MSSVHENERYVHLRTVLSDVSKVSKSKVLMVGAGGIGCELLKNLVMTGFKTIEVVDLDTIDLSNLNRQFLFRNKDIRKSKAHYSDMAPKTKVAREAALRFNPNVNIISHHSSIFEEQFDVVWFQSFDLEARRHVNLMCMAANVPLVESGTAGYFGQVSAHKRDLTHCFDCEPKPTPKTFPVCTIRSTPSIPLHCIVWAKNYLFAELFGMKDTSDAIEATNEVNGRVTVSENAIVLKKTNHQRLSDETKNLKRESAELSALLESSSDPKFAEIIFKKVYETDIKALLAMEDLWKLRKPPTSQSLDEILTRESEHQNLTDAIQRSHTLWSVRSNAEVFLQSLRGLNARLLSQRAADPESFISFDKDDDEVMDFVAAAANLRGAAYGIEMQTLFKAKEMAGNIIPAIATTNAIIAGLIVLEAIKILAGDWSKCKHTHVVYGNKRKHLVCSESLPPKPAEECGVCRNGFITVAVDTDRFTVGDFVRDVVRGRGGVGFVGGEVTISEGNRMLYDEDFTDNEDLPFKAIGLTHSKRITVGHENDDEEVASLLVFVIHRPFPGKSGAHFEVIGDGKVPSHVPKPTPPPPPPLAADASSKKRKLDDSDMDGGGDASTSRRRRVEIVVEDDEIL
ncbi:E1 ubiquitin-activating protein uba2 [Dinochytrium kinnereticum]|nr:E1 ubiquitin-activating protein uba2 [Dinochytrium kinnereticum]